MGEREMMLALAAIMFLSTTSLSINRYFIETNETTWRNEYDYMAVALGQKMIEEAKTRLFDRYEYPNFTSPYSLGALSVESYPYYNDVDDFRSFARDQGKIYSSLGDFEVTIDVFYVDENDLETPVSYLTVYKHLHVTVYNENMTAPIHLKHIFSYIDNG